MNKQLQQDKVLNELVLDSNSIVLDLGANLGDISNYIYSKFQCNLFLYEPNPYCYQKLKNRFKQKNKIKIFNQGVLNMNGFLDLYLHVESQTPDDLTHSEASSYYSKKDNIDKRKKILTRVIDIKEVIEKHDYIDLIKIDIEGAEYLIMDELIKNYKKIDKVICELHGKPKIAKDKEGKMFMKNKIFKDNYKNLIKKLKSKNLFGNWFVLWD